MSKETTTVKILGASYKIACPPEESEEVKKAAIFLDNKLNEVKEASGLDEKRAARCCRFVREFRMLDVEG